MKQLTVMFNGKVQNVYLLDLPRIVIGRGAAAQISLENNPFVSRQHAVIMFEGATHVLQDLGGPNGTFIGEKRVRVHPLMSDERILLGKHSLRYEDATPKAESLKAAIAGDAAAGQPAAETMTFESAEKEEEPWQKAVPDPARKSPNLPTGRILLDPNAFNDAATTVAASKDELDEMVRKMTIKAEPYLSVPIEDQIQLVPLDVLPFEIGWSSTSNFHLKGTKWFGKQAARIEKQHGSWYLISLSPMWSPVEVAGTRIKKKRKLSPDVTITIRGQRFRFNPGERA
jgi:predicted component of type VI protein secretion system